MANKFGFLLFTLLVHNILHAQSNNDICYNNPPEMIILGIKEFDSLIFVLPKKQKKTSKDELHFVMEKKNISLLLTIKKANIQYLVFDTNCYMLSWSLVADMILRYVIPKAPKKYLSALHNTNNYIRGEGNEKYILRDDIYYYKKHEYRKIPHHKFLVILMYVPWFNQNRTHIHPELYRFRGDKAEYGMYLKVLIPLLDDDYAKLKE